MDVRGHKEGWMLKNWCFQAVVLEKSLGSSLHSKDFKPVNSKGNQPQICIWRADAEAEASILWPPDAKNRLIGKDTDAGKEWRKEKKGMTEDEIVGWHHRLNGHEFEQSLGVGDGQEAWRAAVHGVAKSWTRLSNWTTITADEWTKAQRLCN